MSSLQWLVNKEDSQCAVAVLSLHLAQISAHVFPSPDLWNCVNIPVVVSFK